jgi:p-aminobenzoyl-glutamate transporter AbgT
VLFSFPLVVVALTFKLSGFTSGEPAVMRIARPSRAEVRTVLVIGGLVGLFVGLVDLLFVVRDRLSIDLDVVFRLAYWLLIGLAGGLVVALVIGSIRAGRQMSERNTPTRLWSNDLRAALTAGLVFAAASWLLIVIVAATAFVRNGPAAFSSWHDIDLSEAAPFYLAFLSFWILLWLVAGLAASQVGLLAVTATIMRLRRGGTIQMIRFLEDARGRQVLRQAGATYQFRHARLQDRTADQYEVDKSGDPAGNAIG